ncbi:MAG: hypothetical protein H7Y43_08605, partial [Akkermansiaceae bacterium]|nr:hypothetical protein [Verrucomicrobiales bacterium]
NSIFPASTNGPGYVNYAGEAYTNGNGTFGITNNFVYIGNRDNRARAFNGRYDDVRLYANKVLTQAELDQVRQDPGLPLPQRLTFTALPQNTTVAEGQGASFTATTTPAPNPTYQWYRINPGGSVSNVIAGATNQTLEIPGVTIASDNGAKYGVKVFSTDPFAGYNGAGTNSSFALLTVVSPATTVVTPGMLKFEYFANTGIGQNVDDYLAAPTANYTNNTPNLTKYLSTFNTREVFANDSINNYFVRVTGSITPTESTNYVFFIRAGDHAQLYLSTDGGASSNLIASDAVGGEQQFTGPESSVSFAGARFSTPQALTAGTTYPITAFLKAGVGADVLQVAWRTDSGLQDQPASDEDIADRLKPLPAAVLSTVAVPSGTISISSQPAPAAPSVVAHTKVTLTVGVTSSLSTSNAATLNGPVVIQWQKNGTNILGAVGASYTTPYLTTADNGATYGVIASIPGAAATSSVATVTVSADNVLPTVVSAASDDSMMAVTVRFSEPVDAATALNPANYSISGLAVTGAKWAVDTNLVNSPAFDSVKLTTALQGDATTYTVTVTGVKDTANNTIAGSNTASFQSYRLAAGFVKFEYFEVQTYNSMAGQTALGLSTLSPKFTNSDPDTVIFPTSAEMTLDGTPTIRSASGGNPNQTVPYYGTRLSTVFVPAVTTNYVFYIAGNDSAVLWLSTNANAAHKHMIAYLDVATGKRNWDVVSTYGNTTVMTTNVPETLIVGATPWPVADGSSRAVITLTAGQRYYLQLDHLENAGFDSFNSVTYAMAADNDTAVAPADNTPTALNGSAIGWYFPPSPITSITPAGSNVIIAWLNGFSSLYRGVFGYPGLGFIPESVPVANLQSASVVTGPYANLTNTSPATLPATAPAGFFRIGQ